jgi:hypothetical protein
MSTIRTTVTRRAAALLLVKNAARILRMKSPKTEPEGKCGRTFNLGEMADVEELSKRSWGKASER